MEVNENSSERSKGFDDDPSDDDPFDSDDDEEMDLDFLEMELPSSVNSRKYNANSQSNLKRGKMLGSKNKIQNAQMVHRSRKDIETSQAKKEKR